MLFSSGIFLFWFLPITILIYYAVPSRVWKNFWLFGMSLFFYAWGEPLFVFVMLFSILFNYAMGYLVNRISGYKHLQKCTLVFMVFVNLSVFFVFKYLDFMIANMNAVFGTEIPPKHIALPIGISFFTFQAMSYVLDVYRNPEKNPVQKNPFHVGLYITLFPQLIAGPIVRYETVANEIKNRKENRTDFSRGLFRFAIGFCKKVLIANNMAIIADLAFGVTPKDLGWSFAWLGAICYTFQIYYDFSGYSDMAIGLGKVFGFHFLENFRYPYCASSITDFWRRWHISLSTWFRDYVYIPLGGSRNGNGKMFRNLFLVWVLTGIWHGASWNFVLWGLYYFCFLAMEKFILKKDFLQNMEKRFWSRLYVFLIVLVGWVLFRAENLPYAVAYIKEMFSFTSKGIVEGRTLFYVKEYVLFFVAALLFSTPLFSLAEQKTEGTNAIVQSVYHALVLLTLMGVFYIAVIYIVKGSYNPFIYFNF